MKSFLELLDEQSIQKGLYVAAKFDKLSLKTLKELQISSGVVNPLPVDDLHCTIVYSREFIDFPLNKELYEPCSPRVKFKVFELQGGQRALVLCIKCKYLTDRHNQAMREGATYDYPDYISHITLSYDIGNQTFSDKSFTLDRCLVVESEYSEELNLSKKY